MFLFIRACLVFMLGIGACHCQEPNDSCPPNTPGIDGVRSFYNGPFGERSWDFRCVKPPGDWLSCHYTPEISDQQAVISVDCGNGILSGAFSRFETNNEKLWSFLCCNDANYFTTNCQQTQTYPPRWNFMFTVFQRVFNAMRGTFDPQSGDRRWTFRHCGVRR